MPTQVAETSSGCTTFAMVVLALLLVVAAITIPIFWKNTICDHRITVAKAEERSKFDELKNELKLQVRTLEMQTTKLEIEKEQFKNEKITLTAKIEHLESDLKELRLVKTTLVGENTQLKNQVSQIDIQKMSFLLKKGKRK